MPAGESWDGVYESATLGKLELAPGKEAGVVVGLWETADAGRWGELRGHAEGNVLRFEWNEHTLDGTGPALWRGGSGYFVIETHAVRGEVADVDAAYAWRWMKRAEKHADLVAFHREISAAAVPNLEYDFNARGQDRAYELGAATVFPVVVTSPPLDPGPGR